MDLPLMVGLNLMLLAVGGYLFYQHIQHTKHINEVLSSQKRRLNSMISSLADGVVMLDENKNLVGSNPAAGKLLGITVNSLDDLINTLGPHFNLKGAIEQTVTSNNLIRLPQSTFDGKILQVDVEPIKEEQGKMMGVVIVIHDLTFQNQLQRLHDDFTAMMVHELRTPLTTTLYSTNMMIESFSKLSPQDILSQLTIIKSSSTHLLTLVNDLLDVSKIEAGKFQIVKQSDDLKHLLEEKISTFQPLAAQKKLQLSLLIDPHLPNLSFDQTRISQVLDNLISNAIKYSDAGTITLTAAIDGPTVKIEVTDTGDGIKAEDLSKLFSKFEQLGKAKSGEKKGTGLGLVITKGIVEAHGGKIWARSEGLGRGSTFGFSLPLS